MPPNGAHVDAKGGGTLDVCGAGIRLEVRTHRREVVPADLDLLVVHDASLADAGCA